MSGLSASTYSWGGDGSLLRGGVEALRGWVEGLGTFGKNLRIPSFFCNCRSVSTSDGTEERSELSSSDMVVVVRYRLWSW